MNRVNIAQNGDALSPEVPVAFQSKIVSDRS